jgi:hypothetical protein
MRSLSDLRADFVRRRMEFIHTELDTGAALARLAHTERQLGRPERARRQLALALHACKQAKKRIRQCDREEWPEAFDSANRKLALLLEFIFSYRKGGKLTSS